MVTFLQSCGRSRRFLLLGIAGGLAATGFPPVHLVFFLIPAFVGLFWAIDSCVDKRSAMFNGWSFGVGHFAVGFYWVGHAFLVDSARYGWLAPFAIFGLAAGLALFPALVALVSKIVFQKIKLSAPGRVLIFVIAWISMEWVRGWVLTGFPWNQIGAVWAFSETMMQFTAVAGVLGLGLVTMIGATLPAVLAYERSVAHVRLWPVGGFVLLLLVAGFGFLRLPATESAYVDGIVLRLVQPNIPQHLKWKPDLKMGHVRALAALSLKPPLKKGKPPTHFIWPETAVPFNLQHDKNLLKGLGEIVPPTGLLLTGAPRSNGPTSQTPRYWNSLIAVTSAGEVAGFYDKRHLVPFGEYVPWRSVLDITKLTAGRGDFSPGETARTMALPGLPPFAPLICYEIIFSDDVRTLGAAPKWILNITNDAWFGHSPGPFQHLALAQFRAVEMGVPVVRVANTGISALVDPYGRIIEKLDLGAEGILDVGLPRALAGTTVYARFGDAVLLLLLAFCFMVSAVFRK